jgi:hypothetical protein
MTATRNVFMAWHLSSKRLSLYCFANAFTSLQFSKICSVSVGEGDEPSDSMMGKF